jgi:hypothetical protein
MNKVFLSSAYQDKPRMKSLAELLRRQGLTVVSSWVDSPGVDYSLDPAVNIRWAVQDEQDLMDCDTYIQFDDENVRGKGQGGRYVELGIARATEKRILIVGEPVHVFHYLPGLKWFKDIHALLQYVEDQEYANWVVE